MKSTIKKIIKIILRVLIISTDVILVPCLILFRWLSDQMLQTESECLLLQFNGKCLSCGGTHFVNDLLSGRIFDAFMDNHFFFICTLHLFVTLIALNLWVVFNLKFAKTILKFMYNIPVLILFVVILIAFLILRNIPMIICFTEIAFQIARETAPSILANDWETALKNPTFWDTLHKLFPFFKI